MRTLIRFLLSLILFTAGLLLAASIGIAAVLMLAIWGVRTTWAKLTGRKVSPFVFRVNARGAFAGIRRPFREIPSRTPRADAVSSLRRDDDVVDV